jgi:hypothetical protein
MHIGTFLMPFGSEAAQEYYTPWFPKGADNAYFTYEIIRQSFGTGGSPGFSVQVYTKNREDVGTQGNPNTAVPGSWVNLTGTSFYEFKAENLRQLVRFKIIVKGGTTPPSPAAQEGVFYRFLAPTWYDKAV